MGYGVMTTVTSRDCGKITVNTLSGVHRDEPVFYSCLPRDTSSCKQRLISSLWEHCVARGNPHGKQDNDFNKKRSHIQVGTGLLGKPYLLVGDCRGPSISFSEGEGKLWAALSGGTSDIGIDLAGGAEFPETYPFDRVFHQQELQHAMDLTGGNMADASALLWSIKEAVVKSLGCAFHVVSPRQLDVSASLESTPAAGGVYAFTVELTGKAREYLPPAAGRSLGVSSLALGASWFSIAQVVRMARHHA